MFKYAAKYITTHFFPSLAMPFSTPMSCSGPLQIQKLDIVPWRADVERTIGSNDMHDFLLRCPNLKYLIVKTFRDYWGPWGHGEGRKLPTDGFPELREFELKCSEYPDHGQPRFMDILKAPQLTSLSLDTVDLRCIRRNFRDHLPDRSSALKVLKLRSCLVDAESITTLLRKPIALESLEFGLLEHDREDIFTPSHEDLAAIKLMLRIPGREQQGLSEVKLIALEAACWKSPGFKGALDFSQINGLKELCLQAGRRSLYRRTQVSSIFNKLPSGLEHIKFLAGGGFDMAELAETLLDPHSSGVSLPISLKHLEFYSRYDHQRPFNRKYQIADEELQRHIAA